MSDYMLAVSIITRICVYIIIIAFVPAYIFTEYVINAYKSKSKRTRPKTDYHNAA